MNKVGQSKVVDCGVLKALPIEVLRPGIYQPRGNIDIESEDMKELANSIALEGVHQALLVRSISGHMYEIVCGERRWRAAQIANLSVIPCVIKDMDDKQACLASLSENIKRKNLSPIEEAKAIQRFMSDFNIKSKTQASRDTNIGRPRLVQLLELLRLPEVVKELINRNTLKMVHGRELCRLIDYQDQIQFANLAVKESLSHRQLGMLITLAIDKKNNQQLDSNNNLSKECRNAIQFSEGRLSEWYGQKVKISHSEKRKSGYIQVHYNSLDELQGVLERMDKRNKED